MKQLVGILRIVRSSNLLMMMLTQLLAFASFTGFAEDGSSFKLFLAVSLATILCAGAGYIINDMEDLNTDLVNKPERVIVNRVLPGHAVMYLYLLMNVLAVIFAAMINKQVVLSLLCCMIALWFYAIHFKGTWLTGNLIVSAMSAFVLLIYPLCNVVPHNGLYYRYGVFAFMISMIREIIKDAEDIRGDQQAGFKTIPVRSGIPFTAQLIQWICVITLLLLVLHLSQFNTLDYFTNDAYRYGYLAHMIVLVFAPLCIIAWRVKKSESNNDFGRLSLYCKLIMLTGLISMLYLKA